MSDTTSHHYTISIQATWHGIDNVPERLRSELHWLLHDRIIHAVTHTDSLMESLSERTLHVLTPKQEQALDRLDRLDIKARMP
jgi:hypothetical protein